MRSEILNSGMKARFHVAIKPLTSELFSTLIINH